jgi:hypothetical protein
MQIKKAFDMPVTENILYMATAVVDAGTLKGSR